MLQLKWFRIETGCDGSITSCEEVEAKGRNGGVVRFYEAATKAEACSAAKAWYTNHRAKARAGSARRVAAARARGVCITCKKAPPARGRICCTPCQDRANTRRRERYAGAPSLMPRHPDAESAMAAEMRGTQQTHAKTKETFGSHTAYLYARLLRKFDELGPVDFRKWLVAKIEAAKPQEQPAA